MSYHGKLRAYDEVKSMLLWSNALLLGQDIAEVVPLTDAQSEELEHIIESQEREAKVTQMRIGWLRRGAAAQSYFGSMNAIWWWRPFAGRGVSLALAHWRRKLGMWCA